VYPVPRLENFHTGALGLCASLLLAPVQVALCAGHGFVAEDQLDSVGVNAALCQRRTPTVLQTVNVPHGVGDRRLASSHSRLGRKFAVPCEDVAVRVEYKDSVVPYTID
jgi:hypothetical protein